MTAPRIDPLSIEDSTKLVRQVGIAEEKAAGSIYRVLLRQPRFGQLVNQMVEMLLAESTLDPRLRELVIMRIGWQKKGVYEWSHHWNFAKLDGVKESDMLAMKDWEAHDHWSPVERALFRATDETLANGTISQETWDDCVKHFPTEPELIDVVATIGVWNMISEILTTLAVPLEESIVAWPPDGVAPA